MRRAILALALALVVPAPVAAHELTHVVERGQTLSSIARRYGLTVRRIAAANGIADPSRLAAGRRLVIPHRPSRPSPASPALPAPLLGEASFWPVRGPILSGFAAPRGGRRHKGVDIKSEEGSPVAAAAAGVVQRVEESFGTYGRLVTLDHGGGLVSYYGHNARNLVQPGQRVSAGDVIALVGRSGNASTPHLHFEVRLRGVPVDPLKALAGAGEPGRTAGRREGQERAAAPE
ncbi:MAG TPA: LysM peptidoglycan-binding domain-containing M23 family metallopeptidase [Candidatus Polarisedimenticolia bacterium]|nr:LysM peptidoglycan-binding domain-containing M23 family metallopeptidase [Candidatus Polarisedimenticolia bacterium]